MKTAILAKSLLTAAMVGGFTSTALALTPAEVDNVLYIKQE